MRWFSITVLVVLGSILTILVVLYASVTDLRRELAPAEVDIATPDPLRIQMQQQDPPATFKKTVNGAEVTFPCPRNANESAQEWGERCGEEFAAFCEGLEGEGDADGS